MNFTVLFSTPPSKEHRQKCGLWDSLCCFLNVDKGSAAHLHFCKEIHLEQEPQPASGSSGGTFGIPAAVSLNNLWAFAGPASAALGTLLPCGWAHGQATL